MSETREEQLEKLRASLRALEGQRGVLGDAIVEPAIAALRAQIQVLEGAPSEPSAPAGSRLSDLRKQTPAPLANKILSTRGHIEGERKPVTILFSDIVGSTTHAEKLDPEDWREIVNGAHRRVSEAVYRYEGTIAQLLGDGVLAFLGAPVTHEDDPVRAVHVALGIQKAIGEYSRELKDKVPDFKLRIGINTGMVVVGNVGTDLHMEYLAVGDSVNLAARLQSLAEPGGIVISEETYRFVGDAFECTDLGLVTVKGKSDPVRIYRVERPTGQTARPRGIPGLRSQLVGREQELATLFQASDGLAYGKGACVSIIGEPGTGKTRLLTEWRDQTPVFRWVKGACLSYGETMPYHLIIDLVNNLIGTRENSSDSERYQALESTCSELLSDAIDETLPYLADLLSIPIEPKLAATVQRAPGALQIHYLSALRRLLLEAARRIPLIVVVEDVHWIDHASVDLLTRILPVAAESPILFAFTARSDRSNFGADLFEAIRRFTGVPVFEVRLGPINPNAAEAMLTNLLSDSHLPPDLTSRILTKAEGNPFFIEEVVRMFIDKGILTQGADRQWSVARTDVPIEIPENLNLLLLARIDQLPEEPKRTVRIASVIGRQFAVQVLDHVLGAVIKQGPIKLEQHLTLVEMADLIRLARQQPELEYIFRHALVQEAAYNAILRADRRVLHGAVADAMLSVFAGRESELATTLAYHYERAETWSAACQWLSSAAGQALGRHALREAAGLYQRALTASSHLSIDPSLEFQLHFGLARSLGMVGAEHGRVIVEYERALELAHDSQEQAQVHFRYAEFLHTLTGSDLAGAETHYTRALELLEDSPESETYISALGLVGYLYRYQSKPRQAQETLTRAIAMAREQGMQWHVGSFLFYQSGAYLDLGDMDQALRCGLEGLEIAKSARDVELTGRAHSFLSDIYVERAAAGQGEMAEALPHLRELLRHGQEYGDNVLEGFGWSGLGDYAEMAGDLLGALDAYTHSTQVWIRSGASRRASFALIQTGKYKLLLGEHSRAEEDFAQARLQAGGQYAVRTRVLIGLAYVSAGLVQQAQEQIQHAFTLPHAQDELNWLRKAIWTSSLGRPARENAVIRGLLEEYLGPSSGFP